MNHTFKYKLVIILFFMFFFQDGISQIEPREIKYIRYTNEWGGDDFKKAYERESSYDNFGNIFSKIIKVYNTDESIQIWQGGFYEYDANQLLKKYTTRRYNEEVDLWITTRWTDYKYDGNGCRIEEKTTQNIGGQISNRVTYTRNSDCQITSELVEWLGNGFDLSPKDYYTRDYHADGLSYDELFYRYSFIGDSLYLHKNRKILYGQNNEIEEAYWIIFDNVEDTLINAKNHYLYDEYNNLTSNTEYRIRNTQDFEPWYQLVYENEYDEKKFLVRRKTEIWDYDYDYDLSGLKFNQSYVNNYQNSCEGIVEEYNKDYEQTSVEYRYKFVYEGINECLDLDKMDLKITISPNPSDGNIEVFSNVFQSGNTEILVYSTDGKVLLQENEKSRCEASSIDLTSLQSGIYILQLQNGKHLINEKIVIAN
ncbi:MAG: T9SS type A sorting domain-containing protein [Saprospiraceae bacterium]